MKISLIILIFLTLATGIAGAQSLKGLKIYINPGHGGFDSNDRNVVISPFTAGDTLGFWESKSNLVKGLYLRKLLEDEGAKVIMSRTQNQSVDDRSLSAIAEEANANKVDFMISIHSNAYNGMSNYPLMLFHGWDNNPILPQSMAVANQFWDNLISNQITHWTYQNRNVRGDKSFAPASWDGYGVLRPLTVPGLISEGSFHDYFPETYRLMNNDYRRLEAWHHFLAFCSFYGGNPGNKGKIAGFVKDSVQKVVNWSYVSGSKDQWLPLNNVNITLQPGNKTYTTDELNNGFYIFDQLAPGNYEVTFQSAGHNLKKSLQVKVDSAKVTYLNVYLTPKNVLAKDLNVPGSEDKITIYPNPVQRDIRFRINTNAATGIYSISDIAGKMLVTKDMALNDENVIPVSSLANGVYLLHLKINQKVYNALFIKN